MRSASGSMPRRITQADIAADVGVSQALVSIAYRGAEGVGEDTRRRIFESGRRLGYVHDLNAARLASRTRRTLGVFLRDLRSAVMSDVFEGVRSLVEQRGIDLIVSVGHASDGESDEREIESLLSAGADVVVTSGTLLPDRTLREFPGSRRLVTALRCVPGVDGVFTDDAQGARDVIDHLVGLGHRRIAHITWIVAEDTATRMRGYREAMAAHGLEPWVVEVEAGNLAGMRAAGELLELPDDERPTAIFTADDLTAAGVLDALAVRGLSAPRDCSVVGYDDTPLAAFQAISLTSVNQDASHLGYLAAELALSRLEDPEQPPRQLGLSARLVRRGSTGPVPGSA